MSLYRNTVFLETVGSQLINGLFCHVSYRCFIKLHWKLFCNSMSIVSISELKYICGLHTAMSCVRKSRHAWTEWIPLGYYSEKWHPEEAPWKSSAVWASSTTLPAPEMREMHVVIKYLKTKCPWLIFALLGRFKKVTPQVSPDPLSHSILLSWWLERWGVLSPLCLWW